MPDVPFECQKWFNKGVWTKLEEMSSTIEMCAGFNTKFVLNITQQNEILSEHKGIHKSFPGFDHIEKKDKKTRSDIKEIFLKLNVIRICKPEFMIPSMKVLIEKFMENSKFIEPPPFSLKNAYLLSKQWIPIVFILSPGADPLTEIIKFSRDFNLSDDALPKRSLGKAQEKIAEQSLLRAREKGHWIILQNCHMCPAFLPILEGKVVETAAVCKNEPGKGQKKMKDDDDEDDNNEEDEQKIKVDNKFRIWITTSPDENFPS